MAKFFQPAIPIEVKENFGGMPAVFRYRGKMVMVRQICSRWRIKEGWWREEIAREYYQLETSRFICTVYRDIFSGNWYLQRLYD